MNKFILQLFLLFLVSFTVSAHKISFIEGIWDKENVQTVKLFKIENGSVLEISSSRLNNKNKFFLAFSPEKEGLYAIGLQPTQPSNRYLFYFKPGDNLQVHITNEGYSLYGENTPENRELEKWQSVLNPLEAQAVYRKTPAMTYKEFFPLLEAQLKEADNYQGMVTGNEVFDKAFEDYKKLSLLNQALLFLYTPRPAHPGISDYLRYYSEVDLQDIDPEMLLNYPESMELLTRLVSTRMKLTGIAPKSHVDILENGFINGAFAWLTDKAVQGEVILSFARHNKTYEGMDAYRKKYREYLFTDEQKERMDRLVVSAFKPEGGEVAIDFKFPDVNGKEVALSDLKGKVVYIDVWATWCMPCQKEIPFLKKLEHEYEGKDIVFLSVSTDQNKDHEKWKAFIEKEQLGGIQLFAGDRAREELLKPYKITGVPRFILVNKEGQIVNVNAPRPSSNEIRTLLNATL